MLRERYQAAVSETPNPRSLGARQGEQIFLVFLGRSGTIRDVSVPTRRRPVHGSDASISWILTGETADEGTAERPGAVERSTPPQHDVHVVAIGPV